MAVAGTAVDLRAAAYELELNELLLLFLDRRRRERVAEAERLEVEVRSFRMELLIHGAASKENARQAEDYCARLEAIARKLREPEWQERPRLTPGQEKMLAGRFLAPDFSMGPPAIRSGRGEASGHSPDPERLTGAV